MGRDEGKNPGLIPGFHAVKEGLLKGEQWIHAIWVREGKKGDRVEEIIHLAKERGIPLFVKREAEFASMAPGIEHQGVIAFCDSFSYSELEEISRCAQRTPQSGLIVVADHITDEGNLGAIIRTCAFFGVQGLVLPKDRSARVTGKVIKRCVGTHLHLAITRVVNLGRALDYFRNRDFWIIGAAGESPQSIYQFDWTRDIALVMGSEGRGLSPSIRKKCHALISIPGSGTVDSLNVAVAAGIILSEIRGQRGRGLSGGYGSPSE